MLARVAFVLALVQVACAGACGSNEPGPRAAPTVRTEAWQGELSPRPSAEAVVVAEVNGEPIWDLDVARHAAAQKLSVADALAELIDLALLAQEAHRRGLAADPEVAEARRQARVRALMRLEFEPTFRSPDDMPQAEIDNLWAQEVVYLHFNHETHYEVRFLRVPFKKGASPEVVEVARQQADKLHAVLVAGKPTTQDEFVALAYETAQTMGVKIKVDRHAASKSGTVAPFYAAASALVNVGDISPVTSTRWGFDILYLYNIIPEARHTKEEATPLIRQEFYEAARSRAFLRWSDTYLKAASITRHDELLLEDTAAAAPGTPTPTPTPTPAVPAPEAAKGR